MKIRSLRTKILLTMVIALLASMILASVITLNIRRSQLVRQHQDYQRSILKVVKNGIMLPMEKNRPEDIRYTLEGMQNQTDIISLRIISNEGEVRYSTLPGDSGRIYSEEAREGWNANTIEDYYLDIEAEKHHVLLTVAKIENTPSCQKCHGGQHDYIGYLAIESDITSIDESIEYDQSLTLFMSLVTMILLTVTITIVHLRFVQRGLGKVLDGINEVEKGNFQTHIDVPANDEMGRLASSFNHMIDRLNSAREELNELHQEQLERADKLASVGELAAGMAHEIRNPIAGVSAALKVIVEDVDINDPQRPIFEEILRQLDRINRAVSDLLSFARPQTPSFRELNFTKLINRSLKLAYQHAGAAKIKIIQNGAPELPLIVADPMQLEQVIVNLMLNAIQAMPDGGDLQVIQCYNPDNDRVSVKISDTGAGIPQENISKIFNPFFTTKHKGTGLGLAICYGIVKRHGGNIEVTSVPGSGSTFIVTLPLDGHNNKSQAGANDLHDGEY